MPHYKLPDVADDLKKPLVFGESVHNTERLDDYEFASRRWDASYVPGFSELRAENELAVKDGKKPVPIPRLQWVRLTKPDGATYVSETDEGMVEWSRLGYRACGLADLERHGFGWPPAAGSGPRPDGTIRRGGDLALFIVDEDIAARNRAERQAELGDETQFIPESKTGEVYPLDDERKDFRGSDIERALKDTTPNF